LTERPYLILTLRRTGGTSLMSFLAQVSSFPTLQHEPLNQDRVWGAITASFRESGDVAAVKRGLAERLEQRPNIKHCFEIIPYPVTLALIEACAARDYAVFLLTRRDEASRLRSLFLAQATGVWGASQAGGVYPRVLSGELKLLPIDLKTVRARAALDAAALGMVLRFLRHRRIDREWLLFEEIYADDGEIRTRAREIAGKVGVTVAAGDARLDAFAGQSGQGSAAIFDCLPNAAAVSALLEEVCLS
jgi:hypothetical protein